ncbi:MAG: DnaB-like helicase C-terminal domain-containing protein [Nanoarchaeota archaeon]
MTIYVLLDDKKIQPGAKTYYEFNEVEFKKLNEQGWGVYFAVNEFETDEPLNGATKRQDRFCSKFRYVYGDLDIAKAGDGQTRNEKEAKKKILLEALIAKCEPTFIIDTSNGIQPLWELSDGEISKKESYTKAIKGIIEWSRQYGGKADGVFDTARILRKPGFFHQKEEPYLCNFIHKSNKIYSIDELNKIFPYEEKVKTQIPVYAGILSPIDEALNSINIQDIVIRAYAQTGRLASFDKQARLILDNRLTGTFQGRIGDKNFIASSSHEPIKGNRITVVADILGITNSEARKWIIKEFNLNWGKEVVKKQIETLRETQLIKDYKLRYTWGTKNLDDTFAIIKRGIFIVLGSKRGNGKTTFVFDMACKNANLGHRVLFISLEMNSQQIKEDFARRRGSITIPEEYNYQIPENKQLLYEEKIRELNNITNLFFSGVERGSSITWNGIEFLINEHKDLDLIIIDNLDLIEKNDKEDDFEKQKRIVKAMMNFTSKKQIPIILIHHYRKTSGGAKEHGMDELSGSGKIADSAHYIVKITKNSDAEASYPEKYKTQVYLQKARGYNEFINNIYFIKGTFVDEAPIIDW